MDHVKQREPTKVVRRNGNQEMKVASKGKSSKKSRTHQKRWNGHLKKEYVTESGFLEERAEVIATGRGGK